MHTVQLLVASTVERAEEWRARASTVLGVPVRVVQEDGLFKLRVGSFTTEDAAEEVRRDAVVSGYVDATVVTVAEARAGGGTK
ncbi:MAG: SPOR domain-containing protein [Candidatus Eisenbacteria bacterium]